MISQEQEKYLKFNPFLDPDIRFNKMISNYKKYNSLVIGVDFDFTLCCPITGKVYLDILKLIQKMQSVEIKFIFCIWTANENPKHVKQIWEDNLLHYDFYNYSPINPGCIKPHFNILLDDSAGLLESVILIERIIKELEPKQSIVFDTIEKKFIEVSDNFYAKQCVKCDYLIKSIRRSIYNEFTVYSEHSCARKLTMPTNHTTFVNCPEFETNEKIKTIYEYKNEK